MSIKTWQERQAATGVGSISAKEDEIDELRAELVKRDAEIEQLTETSVWQAGRISELLDEVAAQRKVLEMALVALQSLFSFEVDEHRGERCASAITAIQEQLK